LAPLYDLNSNVLAYADVTTSTITHRIDYDPFGTELTLDTLLPTAAAEEAPRFRFSTKYTDSESGLVYYGFRSYSPELGRWVNRDPIEERGGVNLYGMVGNDAVNRWDLLGMYVEVTYNRAAKSIIVRDVDTGATLTLKNVFSGNGRSCCRPEDEWKENEGPLPGGKYLIGLGYDSGHGGDDWWYKLYGDNGSGGYSYTDIPVVAPDGIIHHRGGFNLHTGRASDGCVTVWSDVAQGDTGYPKSDDYNKLKAMLDKTKPLEYKGSKFSGWLQVN
jgi:RHS repeat-associated protein